MNYFVYMNLNSTVKYKSKCSRHKQCKLCLINMDTNLVKKSTFIYFLGYLDFITIIIIKYLKAL